MMISINTYKLVLVLVLVLVFFSSFIRSLSLNDADEPSILLSIKAGIVDPLGLLKDWSNANSSSPHCSWTGVSCNSQGSIQTLNLSRFNLSGQFRTADLHNLHSLTSLNLSSNDLSSFLPNSLPNLASLTTFDVSQNSFTGEFPTGFTNIPGLTYLNASGNNFSGDLPITDLANATLLKVMDLRGNFFQGPIPASYQTLKNLEFLGLSGNNLSGHLPPELGHLSSLETLILGYNQFEGGIPLEFGSLTSLKYLDLAIANLGGEIPHQLGQLSTLTTLFLYSNNLEGEIPSSMGNLSALVLLDLSDNNLSGEIPEEIAEMKRLELLSLMCNKLSGPVPPKLGELANLQVLELWNNSLSGPLPADLGRNSPLQWLDVSSNAFSGEIPDGLCSGGNLTKLILFNNKLTGPIPPNITRCSSLVRVRMQNNRVSGSLPVGLGKLAKLQRLEVAKNNLSGEIPDDLSSSPSLSFIDLSHNRLQSSLPSMILSTPNLQTFIVANNHLRGEIPAQFQDCPSLSVLDLSSNHFTGTIPASIASCERMVSLNLNNNQLTGQIPDSIAMMPSLALLDLSNNSLAGKIPDRFGSSPALETFNVSYNNLTGRVPANGILRTISPSDLVGNHGLCGSVLPPCSMDSLDASGNKRLTAKHMLAGWVIGISSILAFGIAGVGSYNLYKRCYSNGGCFKESFEMSSHGDWPWRLMAFQRVSFTSTDILACIKEPNVIGMGATGVVYKAEIPRANSVVAVKKLWRSTGDIEKGSGGNGVSEDLVEEVNLLGKLRHRNIVRLVGFLHNNKDAMMIYEYMENGNVGEGLHGKEAGKLLVDWVSRYNIAVGTAQGLAYLHHDCNPPVIHRDVKSSNILLDANLEVRIADFGLARMMIKKNETVSMVAGSYGYIAPEYGYTLKVDEKSDIYSFGVVLLELVTGKRPLEPEFGESADVVEWVRSKVRNNEPIEGVLDTDLRSDSKNVEEEMAFVLRIALLCTAKLPKDRPSMRDVITMLGEAKPRRKNCSSNSGGVVADKDKHKESDKDKPVFSTSPVNGLL